MHVYHIVLLAIVQGLTEFIPVSSSGHLILMPIVFGWQDQGLLIDIAVHTGTLCAVLIYFWRDVAGMIRGFFQFLTGKITPDGKKALLLIVATLPVVLVGYFVKKQGLIHNFRGIRVVCWSLVGWGVVMAIADYVARRDHSISKMTPFGALVVGVMQCIALIPGTSRSGICIIAMRFLGYGREEAAKFSFLLSIPAIAGASVLGIVDAVQSGAYKVILVPACIGAGVAFVAGLGAINFMLKWLRQYSLLPFACYRVVLGITLIMLFLYGKP